MNNIWEFEDVNLFQILCPHKYKEYSSCHLLKNYSKNDYIYFEKDSANKVFLIDKGKVKIGYYTEDGEEVINAILSKGEIFGEKSILGIDKHTEFAQSLDANTQICSVTKSDLLELMKDNVSVSLKIYKFIGFRIKRIERRLEILLFKDIKTRLLEFLHDLKEEFAVPNENGDEIAIHPYTQNDIAKLIGTSRSTLNIFFNELKQEGKIDFGQKKITFFRNVR